MDYKIDGRMIFLVLLIIFLGITFYSIIEIQERPHSKTEISRILREDFFRNRSEYQKLALHASGKDSLVSSDLPEKLHLKSIHYSEEQVCLKKNVVFNYKDDLFNPEDRTISFQYFPEGICSTMIEKIKRSGNKWNWIIYLDKNWIAESVKKTHN
jgi:hypothetical protein